MQKWDVPREINRSNAVPSSFRDIPVSVKTAKLGSPIGLGDVRRQRQINHDFLLIVGFWKQHSKTEKHIVDIGWTRIGLSRWESLWGDLCLAELEIIDAEVKDLNEHYTTVRSRAREWKSQALVKSSAIVVNPKIDSKSQRRIQCSMPYKTFWESVDRPVNPRPAPDLWGTEFPNPLISSARKFV